MIFSSLTFLFYFLPITLGIYFLARSRSQKNMVLLVASIFFYAWGEPLYVFLILLSTVNDYLFSNLIQHSRDKYAIIPMQAVKERQLAESRERLWFVMSVIINLGLLVFFKYADFVIVNLNSWFRFSLKTTDLPLPIGISFYTFQTMSYSIDVYLGKVRAQKNFLTLATYVALFPQLIAGPIVRYQTIEDELDNRHSNVKAVADGIRRFIVGLAKKVLVANQMGLIADTIFVHKAIPEYTIVLWLGVIAYTFQIYFDFSGYSDMAIGLGKVFGFHFLENFNYPYSATSITDFWRRWHISLGTWFRDYVYIPLGGNQKHQYVNIIVVWLLTGLWHGASWNYILWGVYYGGLLTIEKIGKNKINLPKFMRRLLTMLAVVCGWAIFRLEDINDLANLFYGLWNYTPINMSEFIIKYERFLFALPILPIAAIVSVPWLKNKIKESGNSDKICMKVAYDGYLMVLLFLIFQFLAGSNFNPFIYFRF